MTTAREIIARAVAGDDWREGEYRLGMGEVRDADELNGGHRVTADDVITTLTAAGFRIVGPGEEPPLFMLSASLVKQDHAKQVRNIMMGYRRCANEDEARGSFTRAIEEERPGFAIEQILSMEVPPFRTIAEEKRP